MKDTSPTPVNRANTLAFRLLLVTFGTAVVVYTILVVMDHGWGLFSIFFGDMADLNWRGQFNLDFMGFLTLSAVWLAWRHQFKPIGLMIGLIGLVAGIPFLTAYLLVASVKAKGDMKEVLLGKKRLNG